MVAEIKKGNYVYYHCTGSKGKCDEPYVREEALKEQLAELLGELRLDGSVLEQVTRALREAHGDEKRVHDCAMAELGRQHGQLQERIDSFGTPQLTPRATQIVQKAL